MARLPLRLRVGLAYALMGLVLSAAFAAASVLIAESYEHILVEALLEGQSRFYLERAAGEESLPVAAGFAVYRESAAPLAFRGLGRGVWELEAAGDASVHVGVYGPPGGRIFLALDVGEIETLEWYMAQIMVGIVGMGTVFSGLFGWLLAGRTVRPVGQLAQAVGALPIAAVPTQLARAFSHDELGQLASAIDAYQQRLFEADAAEKLFFANASHELRTPITVVQGAIEVMRDDAALMAGQRPRMDRLNRGVSELAALLEALLLSARGLPDESSALELRQAFIDALARTAAVYPDAAARFELAPGAALWLRAPRRWLDCILNVLVLRVLSRAPGAGWNVQVDEKGLALLETGAAPGSVDAVERSDLGLGLMFVERLARGLGWNLRQGRDGEGRLLIELQVIVTSS